MNDHELVKILQSYVEELIVRIKIICESYGKIIVENHEILKEKDLQISYLMLERDQKGHREVIAELQKILKEKDLQISMLMGEREELRKDFLNKT